MEHLNTPTPSSTTINKLVETCNALITALEMNVQAIGTYGGSFIQQLDSEFVDRIVKTLLKVKYHMIKIEKELKNWLISTPEALQHIVGGLLHTIDQLDTLMIEDGFVRNTFSFFIEELKTLIHQIVEDIEIVV